MTPKYETTLVRATAILAERTKSQYAERVLLGAQVWSGSDLKGKAKQYGGSYARLRRVAAGAWCDAGGILAYIRTEHGRLDSLVQIAVDDFGEAVYSSRSRRLIRASELRC